MSGPSLPNPHHPCVFASTNLKTAKQLFITYGTITRLVAYDNGLKIYESGQSRKVFAINDMCGL